jgi:hypothetical protein
MGMILPIPQVIARQAWKPDGLILPYSEVSQWRLEASPMGTTVERMMLWLML